MVTVIYNRDYPLSVIKVLLSISMDRTWQIAKEMNSKKSLGNYDVLQFNQIEEAMNFFITESIQQGKQVALSKSKIPMI